MEETEALKKYNDVYLDILMKYKEYIEERENLYIADLPTLITPEDEAVKAFANTISSRFGNYVYEQNFPDAAKLAFEHIRDKVTGISLPVQVWLKPRQTITYLAGDLFDKAVALCSVLIALGNPTAKTLIATKDSERTFLVYFEFKGSIVSMNIEGGIETFAKREELLSRLGISDSSDVSAYEFNDKMYIDVA